MKKTFIATALLCSAALATPALADHHMGDKKAEMTMYKNVVEIASSKDTFSTLTTALTKAELVDALKTSENITVFAPTNRAFDKLPEGTLEGLLQPGSKEALQGILKYHVATDALMAADIPEGTTQVPTLEGDTLTVVKTDGSVTVNGANVITADIKGENGVIHIIDSVVIPE
ncbi:MAG: fasciclin [Rickettsiales bacterium]|nr:fasciclin [Rickettsiales bacterium]